MHAKYTRWLGFWGICALFCFGCSRQEDAGPHKLVLANVHIGGYPTAEGLRFFAGEVAVAPELAGRLELDLQLAGVLGNEKEALEKLRFGGIEMACTSVAPLVEFAPWIGALTMPYLFRDGEHMWQVLEGEIGTELLASLEESGFVGLAWFDAGARSFYNRQRPIRQLDDLKGLKIRVQKSEIMREMVQALGASPVSIGFKKVYLNLYSGAIDGAENNLPSYRSERHFEVAGYYSYDQHSMVPDILLIRKASWMDLTEIEREALSAVAQAASLHQRKLWREYSEEALAAVLEAGSKVNEITDTAPFRQAVAPLYEKYAETYGPLLRRIQAVGQ
jgi:tripartite ATP-independent transporter DctP family solute receptor